MTIRFGQLVERDGSLFVRHESEHWTEPKVTVSYWRVARIYEHNACSLRPKAGDSLTSISLHEWEARDENGVTGYVMARDNEEPDFTETVDVPCPKVRKGIKTRWQYGQWEKLLKTRWVRV